MPDSTGSGPLRPGALRTLPVSVCVPFTELVHMAVSPRLCRCSRGAPQGWVVRSTGADPGL